MRSRIFLVIGLLASAIAGAATAADPASQGAPGQAAPVQAMPTQAMPTQAAPGPAMPNQAVPNQTAPSQAAPGVSADAAPSSAQDYKLGVGDRVRITVFNEPPLSGEFAVSANGTLSLPLIGDINVMDKTVPDVVVVVRTQLADGYLKDPKVSAEVTVYRPFFVLGEVKAPGQYPYAIGLTVLNAIATAQGFTPRSDRHTVYIRRSGSPDEQPYRLSPELKVFPGDTLRLGGRYF